MDVKRASVFAITALMCLCLVEYVAAKGHSPATSDWSSFKNFHKKAYKDAETEAYHQGIFNRRKGLVEAHNQLYDQGLVSYKTELNRFSDEDDETLKKRRGFKPLATPRTTNANSRPRRQTPPPATFDWRTSHVVSPVKDQGTCGSCWAFSANGALESQAYIKSKNMKLFSEQQLVDCDDFDAGCGGGNPLNAWDYIQINGGIQSEAAYPYTSGSSDSWNTCAANGQNIQTLSSYNVLAQDENAIKQALVSIGPLSMAMDASDLSPYSDGIYTCPPNYALNHAVLIVGYGANSTGSPYWIVKNQWGVDWGLEGYFYLQRGTNACGMNQQVAYPII